MVDSFEGGGFYRRFTLSDSKSNSLSFLCPSSENEEFICDVEQPSLSSVNLTDSVCSGNSTCSNTFISNVRNNFDEDIDNFLEIDRSNNVAVINEGLCNSEPEDMQEFHKPNIVNNVSFSNFGLFKPINVRNDLYESNISFNEKCIQPLVDYRKTCTSSPLSFCNRKISVSLQDVSAIDIFPLESKTTNAFSTETIPSQSMSSTTKSKDSGFQRSASCLSLNSGKRSFEHVTSKVKKYIKDIKESETHRKKQKQQSVSLIMPKVRSDQQNSRTHDVEKTDPKDIIKTITLLKNELEEKNTILNELQLSYNQLLEKYAEAINQIDLLRLRTSLNYSSFRSDGYSDLNSDIAVNNCMKTSLLNNSNCSLSNDKFSSSNCHNKSPVSDQRGCDNYSSNNVDELMCVNKPDNVLNVLVESEENCNNSDLSNFKKNFTCEMSLKDFSPQSESHSTPVDSVQSVMLRPISRMYSSSSRLDKEIPPLPSSSLGSKNKEISSVKSKKVSKNSNTNNDLSSALNYASNCRIDTKDDKSGTLIAGEDDVSTTYLDSRSISQLELPRVDPFDKVKKWQASLPTISLIRSQSSSSIGSLEDIEFKRQFNSFNTKSGSDAHLKETGNLCKSKSGKNFNSKCLISRSDVDLTSKKNPRIYSDFYDKNIPSDNFKKGADVNGNHNNEVIRSHKNILKRSDAIDYNIADNDVIDNPEVLSSIPFPCSDNDRFSTVLDDSSSMSSSILSSNRGRTNNKNEGDEVGNKIKINNVSKKNRDKALISSCHKKIDANKRSFSFQDDKSSLNFANTIRTASLNQFPHQSEGDCDNNNKKRVCFSKLNKVTDCGKPLQRYAWDSQSKDTIVSKSDLKINNIVPFGSKQNVVLQRTEKLKRFTEILTYTSDINKRKKSFDVGVQVSAIVDDVEKKQTHESSSVYHDHLKEAYQMTERAIKEMERIHGYLHQEIRGLKFE